MNDLNFYINLLNSRERAVIIWIVVFLVFALTKKSLRDPIFEIIKALFGKKILPILLAMLAYVGLVVWLAYKTGLWEAFLIKDTVFWILGTAFVLLINSDKAVENEHYFRKIMLDSLKLVLGLELLKFIVNLYTFRFWVEMVLVPVIVFVGAMSAFVGTKKDLLSAKKLINFVLAFLGIYIIVFALAKVFADYRGFVTLDNFHTFLLPPLLTVALIPFLYFFALVMSYENLFIRFDSFLQGDKRSADLLKRKVQSLCSINFGRLRNFSKTPVLDFMALKTEADIDNLIQKFKNKRKEESLRG